MLRHIGLQIRTRYLYFYAAHHTQGQRMHRHGLQSTVWLRTQTGYAFQRATQTASLWRPHGRCNFAPEVLATRIDLELTNEVPRARTKLMSFKDHLRTNCSPKIAPVTSKIAQGSPMPARGRSGTSVLCRLELDDLVRKHASHGMQHQFGHERLQQQNEGLRQNSHTQRARTMLKCATT